MTDIIPDNKILNLSNTSGSVLRKFRILYVLSSGYSQSASLLAHNRITAPQFIRRSLHSSWYKQVPTHCLLLFAIEAGDLLDSVKKIPSGSDDADTSCTEGILHTHFSNFRFLSASQHRKKIIHFPRFESGFSSFMMYYIRLFYKFPIYAFSSFFQAYSSIILNTLFKMAGKILIILIQHFLSSSNTNRNYCPIL